MSYMTLYSDLHEQKQIFHAEGVRDISVKLNDTAENIILSFEYIPMLGGVEIV